MPPKILIVDDEPFNIDYLEQELGEDPFTLLSAGDGREALELARTHLPDLILLDMMMPVMDGFQVLQAMQQTPDLQDIPVIVISADTSLNSIARAIQLGAEDYLPKPFEPVLLHARVDACLERKRLRGIQKLYLQSLEKEMAIARDIQRDFLPDHLPQLPQWDLAVRFKGASVVAGDYYDAFLLAGGSLVFLVGDVCGKGIGAALYMTLFRSLIRATATGRWTGAEGSPPADDPAATLKQVVSFINNYILDNHGDAATFSTLFIGMLDPGSGRLSYANCGNEPPWLKQAVGLVRLERTGPVLGVFPEVDFPIREAALAPGDLLVAYTDGVTDALNEAEERFGDDPVKRLLAAGELPAEEALDRIDNLLTAHTAGAPPFDDITLLALRRR